MRFVKFLIRNIHIWRYHGQIERTCIICGKHQINVKIIHFGVKPPYVDNWKDLN